MQSFRQGLPAACPRPTARSGFELQVASPADASRFHAGKELPEAFRDCPAGAGAGVHIDF